MMAQLRIVGRLEQLNMGIEDAEVSQVRNRELIVCWRLSSTSLPDSEYFLFLSCTIVMRNRGCDI